MPQRDPRPPQNTATASSGMRSSFVGPAIASAPIARATTWMTDTTAKGTKPIQSRFMILLIERAGTIIVA